MNQLQKAQTALHNLHYARVRLADELRRAFPVGCAVISHKLAKPIAGTVMGVCGPVTADAAGYTYSGTDGYVVVKNDKTGKTHSCFALDSKNGLERV